ncbi:putative galactinol--sucrose galactosyltransferase 1 [Capsicum chinense]|nr:putative galactinol--sucrose galactosyltransferase 1 [Capsicum chinense]
MKDLGVADVILGIRIHRTPQGLALSQSHYIENVLDKFKYKEFGIAKTSLDVSFALRKNEGESDSQLEYSNDNVSDPLTKSLSTEGVERTSKRIGLRPRTSQHGVNCQTSPTRKKMTVTPKISINDDNLVVHGKTILKGVHDNIILTAGSGVGLVSGVFIGATASERKCMHVFPVGVLEDTRFMCLFRFKLWWMTQRMGACGNDIPLETQFMLVESKDTTEGEREDSPTIYTVFLPLLEGQFRAVLQGNEKNEMEICLESGDNAVETNHGLYLVYMNAGTNPFEVINQAVKSVEQHLQTFHHREKKELPSIIDWFGWCTWDAFYTDVTAEGVEDVLKSLSEGGVRPCFLIIDDGWQQIGDEAPKDTNCVVQEGAQFANRLTGIKENKKFQTKGLKHVVEEAKKQHNVK